MRYILIIMILFNIVPLIGSEREMETLHLLLNQEQRTDPMPDLEAVLPPIAHVLTLQARGTPAPQLYFEKLERNIRFMLKQYLTDPAHKIIVLNHLEISPQEVESLFQQAIVTNPPISPYALSFLDENQRTQYPLHEAYQRHKERLHRTKETLHNGTFETLKTDLERDIPSLATLEALDITTLTKSELVTLDQKTRYQQHTLARLQAHLNKVPWHKKPCLKYCVVGTEIGLVFLLVGAIMCGAILTGQKYNPDFSTACVQNIVEICRDSSQPMYNCSSTAFQCCHNDNWVAHCCDQYIRCCFDNAYRVCGLLITTPTILYWLPTTGTATAAVGFPLLMFMLFMWRQSKERRDPPSESVNLINQYVTKMEELKNRIQPRLT